MDIDSYDCAVLLATLRVSRPTESVSIGTSTSTSIGIGVTVSVGARIGVSTSLSLSMSASLCISVFASASVPDTGGSLSAFAEAGGGARSSEEKQ